MIGSEFICIARRAAADIWGKDAADAAKRAGLAVGPASIDRWLDQTAPVNATPELRELAAERAEVHATWLSIWRE